MQSKLKKFRGGGVTLFLAGLLTVGMAGCGGDEPAPIARPVTPPPAPPPFQPQPVEITLGTSGETVTLMTTEGGGFTLNGEAFESGGNVTAGNGGQYTLTLAEGTWTAQFDAHEIMIPLGTSEETVTITRAEDGSYWLGEMAVRSGETIHTAANGNEYVLSITTDENGAVTWMAGYRMPMIPVMLGLSGDTVTLERREDGSYWLEEMAVTSGETTAHAGNGNTYTLTLGEDGMWMAEYMEMVVEVMLGTSGETVTVSRAEDGGYWLGEMEVESGVTVATASNGNRYRLMKDTEGMWMAEYVPETGTVTVGTLGVTLETVQAEDGSWTVVSPVSGEPETLTDGATLMVGGNSYTLMDDGEGNWMATYREETVTVMLGMSGETVMLTKREDGSYWLGEMRVEDGVTMVTATNGNLYTLSMDADGMWMAMHEAPQTQVTLGTSGTTVTLVREEDGSYTLDGEMFRSGGRVTAGNGNIYTVTMVDGAWMAEYQPESMAIKGTGGLLAVMREDGEGYDVDGALLPSSGMGDIDTDTSGSYRVRMEDGMLTGMRLDNVKIGAAKFRTDGLSADPAMRGDDRSTADINEANTALVVKGENYPFADLLGDGVSQTKGTNFVAEARTKLEGIREKIVQILEVFEKDSDRDEQIEKQWGTAASGNAKTNVKGVLETVLKGTGTTNTGFDSLFGDEAEPDDDRALGEIDDLLEALTSAEELAAALGDDGVLEGAAKEGDAGTIFGATKTESTVTYGEYGNTRYGTITRRQRADATEKAEYKVSPKTGERGAFAFGVTDNTARSRYVQTAGTARYEGETLAVSGADKQYAGDIEISINFTAEKVDGLITNLMTAEGESWEYLFGEVDSIVLPKADLRTQGNWEKGMEEGATIDFGRRAGVYRPQKVDGTFEGRLLGGDSEPEAGSEVVGVWSVGDGVKTDSAAGSDNRSYLAGGFGATRVADGPVQRPSVDDGTQGNAMLVSDEAKTVIANGQLTAKPQAWTWYNENLGSTVYAFFPDGEAGLTQDEAQALGVQGNYRGSFFRKADKPGDANKYKGEQMLDVQLSLADLLASEGGGEFNRNSPKTWVQVARERIEKGRDKIAGLQLIGGLKEQVDAEWKQVNLALLHYVFWDSNMESDSTKRIRSSYTRPAGITTDEWRKLRGWSWQLPSKTVNEVSVQQSDGVTRKTRDSRFPAAPSDALDRIDAMIEALSSVESLEAAFDPGRDGLFVDEDEDGTEKSFLTIHGDDGELFDSAGANKWIWNTSASSIFNQRQWQIKATAGSTDYTRFGVWRIQWAKNALRGRNWIHQEVESFAYSPLPVATAQRRDQLPQGGRATYTGKTVAYLGVMADLLNRGEDYDYMGLQAAYEGEASVDVEWFGTDPIPAATWSGQSLSIRSNGVGGHVTTVLSDLRSVANGDYLYHANKEVRRLIFPKITFGTDASFGSGNHELDYQWDASSSLNDSRTVKIDYRDSAEARGEQDHDDSARGYSFEFVGSSPDGPLGVIGIYEFPGQFGEGVIPLGFSTDAKTTPENHQHLGLKGAFGADLP